MKPGFVVPVREKLAFGLGDTANNLSYTALQFYFMFFLLSVAGLPAAAAGAIYFVARSLNALADFTMGVVSDRARSRFGRRRVFLLAGAIPLGIAFALLWQLPGLSGGALVAYYLVVACLFNVVFSFVSIPYNALMPELTQSYDERTQLSGFRIALSFVGNLLAAAGVALLVDAVFGGEKAYPTSYPIMGVLFGVITTLLVLTTFAGTRERVKGEPAASGSLVAGIRSLWQVREMRLALGLFIANQVAADIFMTVVIFYIKDVMAVDADLTFVIMAIPLVIAVVAAPLWVVIGERLGKRRAYLLAGSYFIVPLLALLVLPSGQLWLLVVVAVFAGVGMSATQVLPWSILPDVVEVDELQNGVRREGMFFGTTLFLYKVVSAVVVGGATALLGAFGYAEGAAAGATQPDSALLAVRLLLGIGPAAFMVVAMLFARALPLSRERFDEVKRQIEARRAGATG